MSTIKNTTLIILFILFLSYSIGDELEFFNEACLNSSLCENTTIFGEEEDIDNVNIKDLFTNIFKFPDSTKTTTTTTTTESSANEKKNVEPSKKPSRKKYKKHVKSEKIKSNVCGCDLTIDVCDINCCCDPDCTEYHSKVFSYCKDVETDKEIEDWYCHKKPFFRHNETRFILEKIVDSLFCIASDNNPPVYSETSHPQIEDESSLKNVIDNNKLSQFKWKLEQKKSIIQDLNSSSVYKHGDVIWRVHKNFKLPLELPQSGFGKVCDFKKTVKFLEDWKGFCQQINLTDRNSYLFPFNYSNFSIIAIPLKFQSQYLIQNCPESVCRSVNVYFCSDSWMLCKNNLTIRGFCSDVFCYNVAKRIRYIIYHNGSDGIKNIDVQFQLANVTKSFKQEFEVSFKWFSLNQSLILERSGNPGYIAGKPIFIGTEINNSTGEASYVFFNRSRQHLTLPMADKSGKCSEVKRHSVGFLEDIKLKCSIEIKLKNFSRSACVMLQNRTYETLIDFMMLNNFDKDDLDRQFISKFGNVSENNTNSWTKILFDEIPQNILTAQTNDDQIQCSGLVTTIMFNVVHGLIMKPGSKNNHVILGVGVTFSQGVDLKWSKCVGKNCEETLRSELVTFVSFHDVSRPARYLIAGGPNLDISLPYDFYFPFVKHSRSGAVELRNSINFYIIFIFILFCTPF